MPKIQLTTPEGEKFEYELTEPATSVGRAPENDFVVSDGSVSSRHGIIHLKGDSIEIEDLGSTNGTHVGGARVERAEIAPGGAFRLGNVQGLLEGTATAGAEEPADAELSEPESASAEPEEAASSSSWSQQTYDPNSGPVIAGLGATPSPAHMRQGFGPKAKVKSAGSALMGVAGLGLAVCAAAVFFIVRMAA